ncbi:J domain-containing protein required for chloroplast accumulation response 1-like [Pyrus x bretschneideri]|uniref:J domain-containing protein required for chloroplast accumulation response 1-like n=1 Tax=Pyrus x bretschneideri TaxID=225117 RepID=UPI00202E7A4F|nr:J domain-containing protein required for chloroplast accumulation response 1-like [Pyrus x bretschneideri]
MSSYVIEINSDQQREEAVGIEEAIAWAKEKFQTHSNSEKEGTNQQSVEMDEGRPNVDEYSYHQQRDELLLETTPSPEEEEERTGITEEEKKPSEKDMDLELLDEDIRLWSAGKESNIRMLLSTLHHIVWPKSGWYAVPLTSLIESSQVKKAYQKARLCLHPDKLQQRGATPAQKYIAERAFAILQDAWAVFISQDVFNI